MVNVVAFVFLVVLSFHPAVVNMKLLSTIIQLSTAVYAAAAVLPRNNCGGLSQAFAEDVVAKFITILNHPDPVAANATAQALLADGYTEISDSILSLEGQPVRPPTAKDCPCPSPCCDHADQEK